MESKIYNIEGQEAGTVTVPEAIFGLRWNGDLVHQVLTSMQSTARFGTADAKGRGEVRGGGKKPWKQKGTGRARHGSSRSPIWKGGGVTHGPLSERNYDRKVNRAMKTRALYTLLSRKMKEGEILFVSDLSGAETKTKHAVLALSNFSKLKGFNKIAYKSGRRALIATPAHGEGLVRSFRNLQSTIVSEVRNLNPIDVAKYKYLVISKPTESLAELAKRA
ncbi:MAG: 50S ribosomal protein L4 [Patescibacteria group bacterium]